MIVARSSVVTPTFVSRVPLFRCGDSHRPQSPSSACGARTMQINVLIIRAINNERLCCGTNVFRDGTRFFKFGE